MQPRIRHLAAVLAGAAATVAAASSAACTLAPTDPNRIRQMMAYEIAHRLGMRPQQIPFNAITYPQLITPLGQGADCSRLGAYHHIAGFRVWAGGQPWPGPGAGPWPGHNPPRQRFHHGVAVLLGYGYSSPVAVNFERRCR